MWSVVCVWLLINSGLKHIYVHFHTIDVIWALNSVDATAVLSSAESSRVMEQKSYHFEADKVISFEIENEKTHNIGSEMVYETAY